MCDAVLGCVFVPVVCPHDANTPCSLTYCSLGACATQVVPCGDGIVVPVAIGAGLGTAAIVGIIIAAVLCAGGIAGGGIYAVAAGAGGGGAAPVINNPIYAGTGSGGANPLHKG